MELSDFVERFSGGFIDDERLTKIYKKTTFCGSGCWENSYSNSKYPRININGKKRYLHRIMLYLEHNLSVKDLLENDPEKQALHKCNNTKCIRPDHLYFGNDSNNAIDKIKDKNGTQKIDYPSAVNIRFELMIGKHPKVIAEKYGISRKNVYAIKADSYQVSMIYWLRCYTHSAH